VLYPIELAAHVSGEEVVEERGPRGKFFSQKNSGVLGSQKQVCGGLARWGAGWERLGMANERDEIGKWGEAQAGRYLRRCGFNILERRWRHGRGEIDLIAREGLVLVFVEVRVRTGGGGTGLYHSIQRRKWAVLRRTALSYVAGCGWRPAAIRYDVIGVERLAGNTVGAIHHWRAVGRFGEKLRF
jgi:putative endonuclease